MNRPLASGGASGVGGLELRDERRLLELGDSAEHLTDEHRCGADVPGRRGPHTNRTKRQPEWWALMPRRRHIDQTNIEPADQRGAPRFGIVQRLRHFIQRRTVRAVDNDPAEQGGDAAEHCHRREGEDTEERRHRQQRAEDDGDLRDEGELAASLKRLGKLLDPPSAAISSCGSRAASSDGEINGPSQSRHGTVRTSSTGRLSAAALAPAKGGSTAARSARRPPQAGHRSGAVPTLAHLSQDRRSAVTASAPQSSLRRGWRKGSWETARGGPRRPQGCRSPRRSANGSPQARSPPGRRAT
jgi:hypothetical protein